MEGGIHPTLLPRLSADRTSMGPHQSKVQEAYPARNARGQAEMLDQETHKK